MFYHRSHQNYHFLLFEYPNRYHPLQTIIFDSPHLLPYLLGELFWWPLYLFQVLIAKQKDELSQISNILGCNKPSLSMSRLCRYSTAFSIRGTTNSATFDGSVIPTFESKDVI